MIDFDVYLFNAFLPGYTWILSLRFIVIMAVIALAWSMAGTRSFLVWLTYVLAYPFILAFWIIPRFLWRQESWNLILAFLNTVLSFITSLRRTVISLAIFLGAFATVILSSNSYLLGVAATALVLLLLFIYINRFIVAFQPSKVFQLWSRLFETVGKYLSNETPPSGQEPKDLPIAELNQAQLQQLQMWIIPIQNAVLFNRACRVFASRLRDYQNSGLNPLAYILGCIVLLVISILSFSAVNLAIYKSDHRAFQLTDPPSMFIFFYYSAAKAVFNSIPQVVPVRMLSEIASMTEMFFIFCLGAIFVSLLFNVRNQKSVQALSSTISTLKRESDTMESWVKQQYKMTIEDAIGQLTRAKSLFLTVILYFTTRMD